MTPDEIAAGYQWLDDRTFAAMWLIGHGAMFVFVLGMVTVMR